MAGFSVSKIKGQGPGSRLLRLIAIAVGRNDLGVLLQALEDVGGARVQFMRALQIAHAALGPDHTSVATVCHNLDGLL